MMNNIIEDIENMIEKLYEVMFDCTKDVDDYDSLEWQVRDILDEAMEKLQEARRKALNM